MAKHRVAPALEPIHFNIAEGLDRMIIARFFGVAAAMLGAAFGAAHLRDTNLMREESRMARVEPPAVLAAFRTEDAPRVERRAAAQPASPPRPAARAHPADPWWTVLFASSAMAAETRPRGHAAAGALGPAPLKITDRWIPRAAPQIARTPHEQRAAFLEASATAPDARRIAQERVLTLESAEAADGRTLRAGDVIVELGGVVLPDPASMCTLLSGKSEPCARRAQTQLELLLRGQTVSCHVTGAPRVRAVGRCTAGKYDLAQWLVKQGWLKPQGPPGA